MNFELHSDYKPTGDQPQAIKELVEDVALPLPERGVICIDTGCGKGGRLTAMVIEGEKFTLHSVPEKE